MVFAIVIVVIILLSFTGLYWFMQPAPTVITPIPEPKPAVDAPIPEPVPVEPKPVIITPAPEPAPVEVKVAPLVPPEEEKSKSVITQIVDAIVPTTTTEVPKTTAPAPAPIDVGGDIQTTNGQTVSTPAEVTPEAPIVVSPPVPTTYIVKQAYNPHRFWLGTANDWATKGWSGWTDYIKFKAYPKQEPGTIPFCVGTAHGPSRTFIKQKSNCAGSGWTHFITFYAYTKQTPGTIPMCVGYHTQPWRTVLRSNTKSCGTAGWTQGYSPPGGVFYVPS